MPARPDCLSQNGFGGGREGTLELDDMCEDGWVRTEDASGGVPYVPPSVLLCSSAEPISSVGGHCRPRRGVDQWSSPLPYKYYRPPCMYLHCGCEYVCDCHGDRQVFAWCAGSTCYHQCPRHCDCCFDV
eukprot:9489798-Pyramimonas_sp.AAC.1